MALVDLLKEIKAEVSQIQNSFKIEVTDAISVPSIDDPDITFDNLDTNTKKCKKIETCVLYIDLRNSTQISSALAPIELARLYSAYVRSMIRAAEYYNGYIRNIVGDRVMVLFDPKDCFINSIKTSFLLNTVAHYIFAKQFKVQGIEIKCGIGIDYGKMLVTKAGVIRQGKENSPNKSLVWLGKPANIASKLTESSWFFL